MITYSLWKSFIKYDLEDEGRITYLTIGFLIFLSVFTVVLEILISPFELITFLITKKLNKKYKESNNK